jgi:hypothetical protein
MAKKQTKAPHQGDPGDEHVETIVAVKETVTPTTKQPKRKEPTNRSIDGWEIKDRRYVLTSGDKPLSYYMKTRGIYYFDEEKGYEREIQFTENQNTPFVDEFKGNTQPGRIVFRNGVLFVPKQKVMKQKFLSIYHPQAGTKWFEVKPKETAKSDLDTLNMEVDAMLAARELDIDMAEAIMRVEIGSKVAGMSSKELRRDLLVFAKQRPVLFLELCQDENVHLRNIGIKATEMGILKLSSDQRTFTWGSTDRKLMNVPFNEHPYSALASFFKTDEGMELLQSVEKQLN